MKKILSLIIIISISLISCQEKQNDNVIPKDINGLKSLLKSKKMSILALENEVKVLQFKIDSIEPNAKRKTPVTAFSVGTEDFNRFSEIQGVIQSDELVKISTEVPGRLLNVYVDNGDKVKKGQLIAKVDVENMRVKLDEINKSYELAKDVFERQERLWKQNIGSEIQYLSAKNNKERLEKGIASINLQIRKSNIYSPSYGVVDMKSVEPGEMVSPGFPLMVILNTKKLKVTADVPESFISKVKYGDIMSIKFPALNIETTGKITRIGNTIHPSNRTFSIEIKLKNKSNLLKPNLLAVLLINDYSEKDKIVIPSELIQHEISGKPFVMAVVDSDNLKKAKKIYVKIGEEYDGKSIINDGLEVGNILIKKGARGVVDEELLEIISEKENH